jgi:hypothetical protein
MIDKKEMRKKKRGKIPATVIYLMAGHFLYLYAICVRTETHLKITKFMSKNKKVD